VQLGSEYSLPAGVRYVTLEDMTIAQVRAPALRALYPPWDILSARTAARLQRRQAALYAGAAACVAATHWTASSIVADYGIDSRRVLVSGFGPQLGARRVARSWSPPRFLFVGVDWERKNGAGVLRAFSEVRRSIPAATLDLVGGHPPVRLEGVTGHGLLRWSDPLERSQLARLFESATCFVMPSLHEAAGMVYVEAGAAGVPSIGTTQGGAATMIGPGGRLVDPSDGEALVQAMLELADEATAARLGEIAFRHAQSFTWDLVAQRTLRALDLPGFSRDLAEAL
jgi:glycosyltransferase involved in cell wall biosynthesis